MGYHLSAAPALLLCSGAADVLASVSVWRRRGSPGRNSLCVALLAAAAWSFTYGLELAGARSHQLQLWGALEYVGTTTLPPAWLLFALQYTGRLAKPGARLLAALMVEPLVVLTLLADPSTRSLIRSYAPGPPPPVPSVQLGPAYWPHFAYTTGLVLAACAIVVLAVMRISRCTGARA
jgi:hypothetical protein